MRRSTTSRSSAPASSAARSRASCPVARSTVDRSPSRCSRRAATSATSRARPTPRSCTPASTRRPARSSRASSAAATSCCRRTPDPRASRSSASARSWSRGTTSSSTRCPQLLAKAVANGYAQRRDHRRRRGLLAPARTSAPGALGGLVIPDESIVCSWTAALAYATEAVHRGADLLLHHVLAEVARARGDDVARHRCGHGRGAVGRQRRRARGRRHRPAARARPLPRRAASRRAARVRQARAPPRRPHRAAGADRARQGRAREPDHLRQRDARPDVGEHRGPHRHRRPPTTGLDFLLGKGRTLMPELLDEEVTATYAGLRAATEHDDYVVEVDAEQRYLVLGGIRSTGLTASMALAEHVVDLLAAHGFPTTSRTDATTGAAHAEHRRGLPAPLLRRRAHRRRPGVRPRRVLLRAGHARRGPRRVRLDHPAVRRRRPASPHARAHGPLPGVLLRRRGHPPARGRPGVGVPRREVRRERRARRRRRGGRRARRPHRGPRARAGPARARARPGGRGGRDPAPQRPSRLRRTRPATGDERSGVRAPARRRRARRRCRDPHRGDRHRLVG